jgi:hypothetical protein
MPDGAKWNKTQDGECGECGKWYGFHGARLEFVTTKRKPTV